jgi:hypothetical protein
MDYINYDQIEELFQTLNNSNVEYVLLRNINNELPLKLSKSKDIDIIVNPNDKYKLCEVLDKSRWLNIMHPWDFGNNFKFLYSMDKFLMFKKNDIHLDVCFQLSCRSFNDGEWFPLDESIQNSVFNNKRKVKFDWKYELLFEDELIHLLTRAIFDKKRFDQGYILRIQDLLKKIELNEFLKKLEKVFFKFSPNLIGLVQEMKYDQIRNNYLNFKEY